LKEGIKLTRLLKQIAKAIVSTRIRCAPLRREVDILT
jgi:hypothetical protein